MSWKSPSFRAVYRRNNSQDARLVNPHHGGRFYPAAEPEIVETSLASCRYPHAPPYTRHRSDPTRAQKSTRHRFYILVG